MVVPVSWFSEVEAFRVGSGDDISDDAGTSQSSVLSLVLSAIGREYSIDLSPQIRQSQTTSFPDRTAAPYWSFVITV